MLTLGIETSCDDTAAAVLRDSDTLLASVLSSQDQIHSRFGGVVPELASRTHLEAIVPIVHEALDRASVTLKDIDLISVTQGPGLIGSLLVGFSYAKALSCVTGIPLVGVDHMAGHLLAVFLEEEKPEFPYIALIVSGGTSSIYLALGYTAFSLLGRTRDDAAGEAFDKVAKLLGLPYPGGPHVSAEARSGNSAAIKFPRAWLGRSLSIPGASDTRPSMAVGRSLSIPGASDTGTSRAVEEDSLDFSFSGLKTSVLNHCNQSRQMGLPLQIADICASFQEAIVDVLVEKTLLAARKHNVQTIVLGGGVSANPRLREVISSRCQQEGRAFFVPRPSFCTDNGAMIALAGFYYARDSKTTPYDQDVYSRSQL
jgi:N6-L-threonylcarbamoyladenine synthase